MTRRTAVLVGALAAAIAALEVIVLSGVLAADRRVERDRYASAIARQRRTAGRAISPAIDDRVVSATRTSFCVHGVDTVGAAIKAGLGVGVIEGGRLDVVRLARLSDLAIRAEKYVEQASASPALPQRLGQSRSPEGDWRSIEPRRRACHDGDGFAAFRLDVPASGLAPAGQAEPTKAARRRKPTRTRRSRTAARPGEAGRSSKPAPRRPRAD